MSRDTRQRSTGFACRPATPVAVPVFDRDIEIARAAASIVEPHHRIVISEGNYLLLDDARWHPVQDRLDFSVFIDVSEQELRRRLMERWFSHGYDEAQAWEKTQANDLRQRPPDCEQARRAGPSHRRNRLTIPFDSPPRRRERIRGR